MSDLRKRALVYGAGNNCIYSMNEVSRRFDVIGIYDGDVSKQGKVLFGHTIGNIKDVEPDSYDVVIVTPSYSESIIQSLCDAGIDNDSMIMLEEALADDFGGASLNIAIIFYGGLGDYIIGKNWLYHLDENVGLAGTKIDAYFSDNMMEAAQAVFDDSELITEIHPINTKRAELVSEEKYDLILRYSIFPVVQFMDGYALNTANTKLYTYALKLREFGDNNYNRGFFASPDFHKTVSALFEMFPDKKYHELYDVLNDMSDTASYHCTYSINIDQTEYLDSLGLKKDCYITVNTGANEEYSKKPSTRTWAYENWIKLIDLLKERITDDISIVRIGLCDPGNNPTKADVDLCGKTSVEQAKVLLNNALVHIDYEGGLVHLRHVLSRRPSVVLHGPTSIERYGYPENTALRSDKCPKACEWSERDWLTVCHFDKDPHACLRYISPEHVIECVMDIIKREKGQ